MKTKFIAVSLVALTGCLFSPVNGAELSISGTVKDSAGKPLGGASVGVPFEEEWNNMAKRERVLVEVEATHAPTK
jgi:hypothetical protein